VQLLETSKFKLEELLITKQNKRVEMGIYGDQQHIIGSGNAKKLRAELDSKDVRNCTRAFSEIF
jgi:hypothetical protein